MYRVPQLKARVGNFFTLIFGKNVIIASHVGEVLWEYLLITLLSPASVGRTQKLPPLMYTLTNQSEAPILRSYWLWDCPSPWQWRWCVPAWAFTSLAVWQFCTTTADNKWIAMSSSTAHKFPIPRIPSTNTTKTAKKRGKTLVERTATKREAERARNKTRVNIGVAYERWRVTWPEKLKIGRWDGYISYRRVRNSVISPWYIVMNM